MYGPSLWLGFTFLKLSGGSIVGPLVLNWSTLEGWNNEMTLELPKSYELGILGLIIQCPNHLAIVS